MAVAAAGALALVTAACGGTGDTEDIPGAENTAIEEAGAAGLGKDPERQAPAPEIEGAQEGGTVTVMSASGLNSMDPTEAYYTNTASILSGLITRSLTQYAYDAETGQMILVPDLATDLGQPNEDFTEWTFEIREGVRYQNGDPVTAEDVAFGIQRSFDRDTFLEGAAYSNEFFLNGDTYKGPYTQPGKTCECVEVDGNTLTITMATPFPDMPYWGAFPAMSPFPEGPESDPQAIAKNGPMATGPYMFADYEPETSLTLVRNPEWDPATDPARRQLPDGYEMTFNDDPSQIDQTLLADQGEAQTSLTYDNLVSADYQQATQDPEMAERLVTGGNPCNFMWFPDNREITNMNVRKALAYAYPYTDVWLAAGSTVGVTRIPGTNIMPPGIPGREEYQVEPDLDGQTTNTAKAKELLEQEGEVGYEISFLYTADEETGTNGVNAKDEIVRSLKEAGFTPKPVATTIENFSTIRADPNANINVRSGGWCSDWPTGSSWMPPLFRPGSSANYAYFDEKEITQAMDEANAAPAEEQPELWQELDERIMTEYFPAFSVGYGGVAMMHGSKIMGMENDNVFGMPTWKEIWISS